jgi:hypothetical protein
MSYLLTIRIPFNAMDDLAARQKAQEYILDYVAGIDKDVPGNELKLQETYPDKPPRNIKI